MLALSLAVALAPLLWAFTLLTTARCRALQHGPQKPHEHVANRGGAAFSRGAAR
jgi:hypothetical protein